MMSELTGQMEMTGLFAGAGQPDGYDAAGNLIDPGAPMAASAEDARRLDVLAGEINLLEEQAKDTFRRTAMEIGRRLTEARNMVPKGRWGEWLGQKINYSVRKAQTLMQVYEEYQGRELPGVYDALSFTQLYDLLAAPPEERDTLAEKAVAEDLSTRELKKEIEALRKQKEQDNIKIYDLLQEDEASKRALKEAQQRAMDAEAAAKDAAEALAKEKKDSDVFIQSAQQRAKDAVERADQSDAALTEARARIAELESREPERVEVVPEEMARELEQLNRELDEARGQLATLSEQNDPAGQARAKRALAAQLQARIAMKHIEAEAEAVSAAIAGVEMLDREKAEAMRGEVRAMAERLFGKYMEG